MKSWVFRACSATAALVIAGVLSVGLQIMAGAAPAGASVTPCGTAPYATNSIITVHCYAPTVTTLQSGTSSCPGSCQFSFYVPYGWATGTMWFTDDNGNGTPGDFSLYEDPVTGWQSVSLLPGTFWLHSADAHGYVHLAELGWGSTAKYSLMAICPNV